jgi:hypothetical protein
MIITEYRCEDYFGERTIIPDDKMLQEYSPLTIPPGTEFLPDAWAIASDALTHGQKASISAWHEGQQFHARIDKSDDPDSVEFYYGAGQNFYSALAIAAVQYALGLDDFRGNITDVTAQSEVANAPNHSQFEEFLQDGGQMLAKQTGEFPERIFSCELEGARTGTKAAEASGVGCIEYNYRMFGEGSTVALAINAALESVEEIDNVEVYE